MLNETETPEAGQTFTPRGLRILKTAVIIMGVLIVLGFGLLLLGIYKTASKIGKAPSPTPSSVRIPAAGPGSLPIAIEPGAELQDAFADGGRLILHLKREGKSEFAVIDLATGQELPRIVLAPR
jgi:hypothetical protein